MTLNVNEPTDARMVNELPAYIREGRVAINAVSGSGNVGVTILAVTAGATSLSIGSELGSYGLELIVCTGVGVATLTTILGGSNGMVKVFIFGDANVRFTDGPKLTGQFYLNHLPALSNFLPQIDDVLAIVNIGGDGAAVYGYWKELYRTISLK